MNLLLTKNKGLLPAMLLFATVPYLYHTFSLSAPQTITVEYAQHGLQIYVDPATGQYGKPPEASTDLSDATSSAQMTNKPATVSLIEKPSGKAGGGYSINLQERYRPSRNDS